MTARRPGWAEDIPDSPKTIRKPRLSIEIANGTPSGLDESCTIYASYDSFEHVLWIAMHTTRPTSQRLVWWEFEKLNNLIKKGYKKWVQPKAELLTDGVLDTDKIIDAWREAVPTTQ